jgi:hypothetical protein
MSRKKGRKRERLEIEEEREWKGIGRLVAANLRTIETRPRHDRYRYNECQVGDSGRKRKMKKKKKRKEKEKRRNRSSSRNDSSPSSEKLGTALNRFCDRLDATHL